MSKRSNVESTIGAIKAKMGEKLRCKTDTAMVNETLVKILCYNITVLIHEMYALGIDISFPNGLEKRTDETVRWVSEQSVMALP